MESVVWSVKNGDLPEVKTALEEQKGLQNETISGRKLIHFAADYGQPEMIEFLVHKGADVNALDSHGITPLCAAVFEGHVKCVKILLEKGADKNGKAPDGTPYIECAETDEIKNLLK
ncbi:hypothetical protein LOTGIDRAFT_128209 [Lottia gigantea]|uniref:Uncharacterized protein n=1 Tax=Lottia gigantea TaxID=225164 RepID=V3ZWH9_LOTGI|nr:hypothetical protein LOTGIDRAFT_128209 [Lottia gigantea]ESO86950.1 hypothetical protein LOTGIDRAFT_128209 [Lottia gigantea]